MPNVQLKLNAKRTTGLVRFALKFVIVLLKLNNKCNEIVERLPLYLYIIAAQFLSPACWKGKKGTRSHIMLSNRSKWSFSSLIFVVSSFSFTQTHIQHTHIHKYVYPYSHNERNNEIGWLWDACWCWLLLNKKHIQYAMLQWLMHVHTSFSFSFFVISYLMFDALVRSLLISLHFLFNNESYGFWTALFH